MSDSVVEFPDENERKHPANPVESRSARVQALELLESEVSRRREATRLDVLILRALISLSRSQPDAADIGFTSLEMADAVGAVRGDPWLETGDKERVSDEVRRQWSRLNGTWMRWREGIEQTLVDHGVQAMPNLERLEGGGYGRMSRYRFDWLAPTILAREKSTLPASLQAPHHSPGIRYICEDINDAGVLTRIFSQGFDLASWRRWAILLLVAVPILASFLVFLVAMLGVVNWSQLETRLVLQRISSFLIVLVATWLYVGPIFQVVSRKIVKAPLWMQDDDDSRLLEHRNPPRYASSSIHAVRYAGVCPVCGGRVLAKSGGLEFWGRLVGRCAHAPVEHVFSFDHVTRSGLWLRGAQDPARTADRA